MRISFVPRFILLSLVYIALFIILVVVEFPLGGPFSLVNGVQQFRGRLLADSSGLDLVELSAHGIVFQFSEVKPLEYQTQQGARRQVVPASYDELPDGYLIKFDDGTRFKATSDQSGNVQWSIETPVPVSLVRISYRLSRNVAIALEDGFDGLFLRTAEGDWAVSNLRGASENDRIELAVRQGRILPVRMLARETVKTPAILTQLPEEPESAAQWNIFVGAWRDKAWSALSGARFNAELAEWQIADGTRQFSNPAFRMQMAEYMARGMVAPAADLVRNVRARHLARLDWQSSAFGGNINQLMQAREAADRQRAETSSAQLQNGVQELLAQEDLVHFVFDRAPSLVAGLSRVARELDYASVRPELLVYLLHHYLAAKNYVGEAENPFSAVLTQLERVVLAMVKAGNGFYLPREGDARADTRLMLLAGKALQQAGAQLSNAVYSSAGQSLVRTVLSQANASAAVPLYFTLGTDSATPGQALLDAELVYQLVAPAAYYPAAVSLYRAVGPGTWVWTASPQVSVARNSEALWYTVEYPAESYHFMAVYGMPVYSRLQLYNINYPMDSMFERYDASGYFYRKSDSVAVFKMRHRNNSETIRMFF